MTIQSLWVGRHLSTIQRLSIASFLANGHAYHLYCYDAVDNAPEGTILRDGRDVVPADEVFGYADGFAKGSPAAFSNLFRYALLRKTGGWWVDTDVVCLRSFDFLQCRVLGSELTDDPPNSSIVSTSVIKAPGGDALIEWAWNHCRQIDKVSVRFGQLGPRLLQRGVDELQAHSDVGPPGWFSPIHSFNWRSITSADGDLPNDAFGIHLWAQMWHAHHIDPENQFEPTSIFERLKRRYAIG